MTVLRRAQGLSEGVAGILGNLLWLIFISHNIRRSKAISLRDIGNWFNYKLAFLLANCIYEYPYRVMVQRREPKEVNEIKVLKTNKSKKFLTNGVSSVALL
jgi:hypothetical protein